MPIHLPTVDAVTFLLDVFEYDLVRRLFPTPSFDAFLFLRRCQRTRSRRQPQRRPSEARRWASRARARPRSTPLPPTKPPPARHDKRLLIRPGVAPPAP